jgi:hypothetical protein
MDHELARHVLAVGFRSASILQELIPLLKEHCDASEYEKYVKAISAVNAEISVEIFNLIFKDHPDRKNEVNQKIDKFGKFI